jgi:hypothetical protein
MTDVALTLDSSPQVDNSCGQELISIGVAAKSVNRSAFTLIRWETSGRLPEHLKPTRNARGYRVFTPEQVEGIRQWMVEERVFPGKALPGVDYNPTPEQQVVHIRRAARARRRRRH